MQKRSSTEARFYGYHLIVEPMEESVDPDSKVWRSVVFNPKESEAISDTWLDVARTLADAKYGAEYFARQDATKSGIDIPTDAHPEWSEVDG